MLRHTPSCSSSVAILDKLLDLSRGDCDGADLVANKAGRDIGEHRRFIKPCTTAGQSQSAHRNHWVAGAGHAENISRLGGKVFRRPAPAKQPHAFRAARDQYRLGAPFTY